MKLVSITTHEPISLDGLRLGQNARITPGEGQFADWRIHVRGPRVILVSPKGWVPGGAKPGDDLEARTMFDLPREKVTLRWSGSEAEIDGVAKWSPGTEPVQTPALPDGLLSKAAKDAGITAESGQALMSDAAVPVKPIEETILETAEREAKKGKRP